MEKEPDPDKKMRYFTKRFIYKRGDKRAETFGPVEYYAVLWVYEDKPEELNINYYCPNCEHKSHKTGRFDGVSEVMFTCDKCDKTIKIPKLRGKRKKKKKK
jgi:hypothetical protein